MGSPGADDMPSESACFHCGQPAPGETALFVQVDGHPRRMCCHGCQAVCEAIVAAGLTDYYRHRDVLPEKVGDGLSQEIRELGLFDHPEFQKAFVRPLEGHEREADLILEGITCAACVWLNERHLAQLRGVLGVQVNYATRRARIRWDDAVIKLSAILGAVVEIGYRAHPYDAGRAEEIARREQRDALWRLLVAGLGMMQVMMYAVPVYMANAADMSDSIRALMHWAGMLLTLPVMLYSAAPFFRRALRDLRLRRVGMDVPVALGIGIAFVASAWATLAQTGEVYFDSVSMFVFFLLGGRYLEMLARQRAMRGVDALGRMLPAFARRLAGEGRVEEQVPASVLAAGDRILVRPGETIVVDGEVCAGVSEVSEAWLTGESAPVTKQPGDSVLGGSVNGPGVLEVRAEKVGEATRLATVRRLMERAIAERPKTVEQADRVAVLFTSVLLGLGGLAGLYWWQADATQALRIVVSVLVVSCPCALSLATPVALTVATDVAARIGLLVTRGHAIETLARANHFVFDKTGTLTTGTMRVERVSCDAGVSREEVLGIAAELEQYSEHAIARAIVEAAKVAAGAEKAGAGGRARRVGNVRVEVGQGISGDVDGVPYVLGRADYVGRVLQQAVPTALQPDSERTLVYLGKAAGNWLAAIELDDALRPDAEALIRGLQAEGCAVSMLSGDVASAVGRVAGALGLHEARAGLSPEDKHAVVRELQAHGDVVAMVGDGINDAPVLAQAHVSVAMAGGTDLAKHQADILLLEDSLVALLRGRRLARKTRRIIRENLAWALAYNLLAIPAAMAGLVTPLIAGIGMGTSSLLVVLNALRIARGA